MPKKARRSNNYKEYPPQTVKKLLVIQQMKGFGLTLDEIREFIELYESNLAVCVDNIPKIREKIKMIEAKIKELRSIKQKLIDCLKDCPDDCRLEKALGTLQ